MKEFLEKLKFDENGLIPAIVQEVETNEILMLAYMNEESLKATLRTGRTHFWSRSRGKLWQKGETSGCEQIVHEILFDCDEDTLLIKIHQKGGACHTGYKSCFYRRINSKGGKIEIVSRKVLPPAK
ncbi:phosphoribosyl-AMP cyclohydrolase [bacterium]|nr:phosphoribosyl-AMP cyclohydrolase [bacterium]MCK4326570.1 phosphoribosyl-AMP cyclohydrolase [bacterium]MCK4437343.1 phosphoribosyl-AMP cyclohydrolase [bacterium]